MAHLQIVSEPDKVREADSDDVVECLKKAVDIMASHSDRFDGSCFKKIQE